MFCIGKSFFVFFSKKWAIPDLFSFIFVFSNKHYNFTTNKWGKWAHPVYGSGLEPTTFFIIKRPSRLLNVSNCDISVRI